MMTVARCRYVWLSCSVWTTSVVYHAMRVRVLDFFSGSSNMLYKEGDKGLVDVSLFTKLLTAQWVSIYCNRLTFNDAER